MLHRITGDGIIQPLSKGNQFYADKIAYKKCPIFLTLFLQQTFVHFRITWRYLNSVCGEFFILVADICIITGLKAYAS